MTQTEYQNSDIDFIIDQLLLRPSKPPRAKISEYAEEKRILPPDTPYPGPWSNNKTPYAVEWMDNMSPHSSVIHQAIMKGHQIGATATAGENVIAYWMDESPAPVMLMSATDDLLDDWSTKRLEPLIDSCGFREKIKAQSDRKSKRSGDTSTKKEYPGGFFIAASAQSPAKMRSNSIRVLIRDEIDGCPKELRTGEGNFLKVSEARTSAWGPRKKITDFSTPTLYETSLIYLAWEAGDRREYKVPCPFCGYAQTLLFDQLRPVYENGYLKNVYHECVNDNCKKMISNHHKTKMLSGGKWVPTVKSSKPNYRSYWISSLYSPVGMLSWVDLYQKYLDAQNDPEGMRSFRNLYLGLPYREVGNRPDVKKVIEHRGEYKSGIVPNEVLWITSGCDVQRGKEKYENLTDDELENEMKKMLLEKKKLHEQGLPRLEIEILGHSHGYRTYSIEYKVFYGHTHDPYSGAWEKMRRWLEDTGLIYCRVDGSKIVCSVVFVDSGDGERMSAVYQFCEPYPGIFPIKGDQALKKKKEEKGDELTGLAFRRYAVSKIGEAQSLVTISTNYYKNLVYQSLRIKRRPTKEQAARFSEFPRDYPDRYFKMLTAEEQRIDKSFHAGGRRNEALDCRVYALCAGDFWLDNQVNTIREGYIKQGMARAEAKRFYLHSHHIEMLKKRRWIEMGRSEAA